MQTLAGACRQPAGMSQPVPSWMRYATEEVCDPVVTLGPKTCESALELLFGRARDQA